MENLIEQYLFQYKVCPLPLIGSLQMKDAAAISWHGDNKLSAPVPQLILTDSEIGAEHFTAFIAARKNITKGEASLFLQQYCTELKKLRPFKEIKLPSSGGFSVGEAGSLVFSPEAAPKEFLPSVSTQRVSHAKPAAHDIRVGDQETNSERMTEFYSDKIQVKKDYWWVWAFTLTAFAAVALFIYFKTHNIADNFGNVKPVEDKPIQQTYRTK